MHNCITEQKAVAVKSSRFYMDLFIFLWYTKEKAKCGENSGFEKTCYRIDRIPQRKGMV